MSGASGKVPAAIHVSPEAARGGAIAKLQDGDVVRLCAHDGALNVLVDEAEWAGRMAVPMPSAHVGTARELFALMRSGSDEAEKGGSAMLAAAGL
jgi:phosphogluconate dehydratase